MDKMGGEFENSNEKMVKRLALADIVKKGYIYYAIAFLMSAFFYSLFEENIGRICFLLTVYPSILGIPVFLIVSRYIKFADKMPNEKQERLLIILILYAMGLIIISLLMGLFAESYFFRNILLKFSHFFLIVGWCLLYITSRPLSKIYKEYCSKRLVLKKNERKKSNSNRTINIEEMDGHTFEHFCADLLRSDGFTHVNVTQGSGDQGVDIVAEKLGMRYAFQCKKWKNPVGNKAVQEVVAGKGYYNCQVGVVLTNSTFTKSAVELAYVNGVLLWDGGKLQELITQKNKEIQKAEISQNENSIVNLEVEDLGEEKDQAVALLLCIWLGCFGAHKFYEGKKGMGMLYFFTMGVLGIGWITDIVLIARQSDPYYIARK